jgi:predicted DNA-binding transcriptional regulator AlpA
MDPVTLTERDALTALLKALEAVVSARLAAVDQPAVQPQPNGGDHLLTCDQAATLLAVSPQWLYRRAKRLKLAVKLGDGTLRFSHAAVMKFIEKNRA